MKKPDHIELDKQDLDLLLSNLSSCNLKESDKKLLSGILDFYIWLQWALVETKLSLHRLRTLFGFSRKTEKREHLSEAPCSNKDSEDGDEPENSSSLCRSNSGALPQEKNSIVKKKVKGHGRLKNESYIGAITVTQSHEFLKAKDLCPEGCGGRLYTIKPQVLICLKGQALASATRYLLEKLRCALCGQVFTANLKPGICRHKYDASLKAHLAVAKNYAGLPFYRIQTLQQMVGVPLPDATQWQLIKELADDITPIYERLLYLAAQGELIHHDDTSVRILSLMRENKDLPKSARRGMYTTGIVSKVGLFMIYLFISGRCHSGENMSKLMALRSPDLAPIMRMADALQSNFPKTFEEILCLCLAHGRRKFYEIFDYFPGECRIVIDVLALVYHYDELTKKERMTMQQRLEYHQKHSAPILKALQEWLTQQQPLAEPNGSLFKAYNYLLKHWSGLTRFLEVAGAPLDNSIVERTLKIPIRTRKNSLFYKNENGARVGGILTSIIHTCAMAGENPIDYLITLQYNRSALSKTPEAWLPWNYRQNGQPQMQAVA